LLLLLWCIRYELHVLLVEHGKVCPQCFKRSNKAGAKRKGQGGAAAPVVCPLAPYKRGGKEAAAAAAAAAGAVAAKTSSSCGDIAAGGTATAAAAAAAGVCVKEEAVNPGYNSVNAAAVAVKVEQLQDFACATAAAAAAAAVGVKREAEEQTADEQQVQASASVQGVAAAMEDAVKQPPRSRKRSRKT
jgi:hypothetical protein